jgi:serine/threonine protein kinase
MAVSTNHTRFEKIRIGGWTMYVSSDFPKSSIHSLREPADQVDGVRGPFNKVDASEYARVFKCSVVFGGRCRNLYVKQFLFRSTWDFVKHIFRPSRAKRAFSGSIMLAENGFYVPQTVALGERRFGPLCTSNFLITRELAGADNLYDRFDGNWRGQSPQVLRDKRRFIKALGQTVGCMHREGIFHGDLRAGNIFTKSSNDTWQFFFLDNERTGKFMLLPRRLRLKNLVQVNMLQSENISNTDRMRFFEAYLEQNGHLGSKWKDLARRIIVKTHRRLRLSPPAS